MNHTTKQLRESVEKIIENIHITVEVKGNGKSETTVDGKLVVDILALLDSVREEYKGMIEGLRMEKPNYGREGAPLNSYWEGYNQAIDEFNSELDEVLKKL